MGFARFRARRKPNLPTQLLDRPSTRTPNPSKFSPPGQPHLSVSRARAYSSFRSPGFIRLRAGPVDVDLKALFHPRIRCALPALPRTGTRYSLGFFSMTGLSPNNNDATVVATGTTCSRRNDAGASCGTSFSMNLVCSRERCFQLPVHCRRTVLRLRRSAPLPPLSLRTIGVCSETTTVVCFERSCRQSGSYLAGTTSSGVPDPTRGVGSSANSRSGFPDGRPHGRHRVTLALRGERRAATYTPGLRRIAFQSGKPGPLA